MTTSDEPPSPPPPPSGRPPINWRGIPLQAWRALARLARVLLGEGESPLVDVRAAFGQLRWRRVMWGMAAIAVAAYLASGIYVVAPGEAAVVRRFGAVVTPRGEPGAHYRIPWPVDRLDLVNVGEVRREVVGVPQAEEGHEHPEPPSKLQVLSGDTNVIDAEIVVQYQVRDPAAYLLNVRYAAYRLVRDSVRQAVARLASGLPVDAILTSQRQSLQDAVRVETQRRLDDLGSGLAIVSLNLQKAYPPDEVAAAFTDVNSAKEDRSRAINEATGYANSTLPEARGQADGILAQASAYRSSVVAKAQGEAQAFESVLGEYRASSKVHGEGVTRYRLYLESLERILPGVEVYAVDAKSGGDVNLRLLGDRGPASPPAASP